MLTYYGLTVVMVWPPLLSTNSLFTNNPRGCVQDLPFGAVSVVCKLLLRLNELLKFRVEMPQRPRPAKAVAMRPCRDTAMLR